MFSTSGAVFSQGPIEVRNRTLISTKVGDLTESYQEGINTNSASYGGSLSDIKAGPWLIGNYTNTQRANWGG